LTYQSSSASDFAPAH